MQSLPIVPSIALFVGVTLGFSQVAPVVAIALVPPFPSSVSLAGWSVQVADRGQPATASQLFDRAIALAEMSLDPEAEIRTLSTIAVYLAQAGQRSRSLALFDRTLQLTQTHSADSASAYRYEAVWLHIVAQIAQAGFIDRALQVVPTLPNEFRKAEALNAIAAVLIERGETEQAKQVLLAALQSARAISEEYAYESHGGCANYKFEVMAKIAANLSVLNQLDEAVEVAQSLRGCRSVTGEGGENYQALTFINILERLETSEQVQRLWNDAQTIPSEVEKAQVWSAIAVKLIELGEPQLAQAIAQRLADELPPITSFDSSNALNLYWAREGSLQTIAMKLAEQHQFEAALQVTSLLLIAQPPALDAPPEEIFRFRNRDATTSEIARHYAIAGQFSDAIELANSISLPAVKALTWIAIAQEAQKAGDIAQATEWLATVPMPPPPAPDDYLGNAALNEIAVALTTAGQIDRAIQLVESIVDPYVQTNGFRGMVDQLILLDQPDAALAIADRISDSNVKSSAYIVIVARLARLGQVDQAIELVNTLPNEYFRKVAHYEIAHHLLDSNQTERALQVVLLEPVPPELQATQDFLLQAIAVPLAAQGHSAQALQAVEAVVNEPLQAKALAAIAVALTPR